MEEEQLPSYKQALATVDWIEFVIPHIPQSDYCNLCRVNSRFWGWFAPLIWRDILNTVRRARLDPGEDVSWWKEFVSTRLGNVRLETRALARVLDARQFALHAFTYGLEDQGWTLQKLFRQALGLLPRLEHFLLDGNFEVVPESLFNMPPSLVAERKPFLPKVLSMANCSHTLSNGFFGNPFLQDVVFVDVSNLQGAVPGLRYLPNHLHILKLCHRELVDENLSYIVGRLRDGLFLWSLDVSGNLLTDRSVRTILKDLFHPTALSPSSRKEEEGAIKRVPVPTSCGYFDYIIEESKCSATFRHPHRYFQDPPPWSRTVDNEPDDRFRSSGREALVKDTTKATVTALLGNNGAPLRFTNWNKGLTHLNLSRNNISAFGIDAMLRLGSWASQLEYLVCDDMPWFPPAEESLINFWPGQARLRGICGFAHNFRPVISANLRELRIHHSLVTNLPTLVCGDFSNSARAYVAENDILRRMDDAYPQTFVPDMNPRLTSLTLTCIPRRSCGPLIDRLRGFLILLSRQERDILDLNPAGTSRRNPGVLKGLRHLRLEFEPDTLEDDLYAGEDMESEALMALQDTGYSFFENGWSSTVFEPVSDKGVPPSPKEDDKDDEVATDNNPLNNKVPDVHLHDGSHEQRPLKLWMGIQGASEHLMRYREVLQTRRFSRSVGFPSPAQKLAGMQREDALVSQLDWAAAVMPRRLRQPSRHQLSGMRDVLLELKRHRQISKAKYDLLKREDPTVLGEPHYFWTGTLQVSV